MTIPNGIDWEPLTAALSDSELEGTLEILRTQKISVPNEASLGIWACFDRFSAALRMFRNSASAPLSIRNTNANSEEVPFLPKTPTEWYTRKATILPLIDDSTDVSGPLHSEMGTGASLRRSHFVPINCKGLTIDAFLDTGSQLDIISLSLSERLKFRINKDNTRMISLPTGRTLQTLGTVEVDFTFQNEHVLHKQTFHVLKSPVHQLIMGKGLLHATKTLTEFAHRIKSRVTNIMSRVPKLHLLGSVTERVVGSINGVPVNAVDDTGSDHMVISWKEAERFGFPITADKSYRTLLELVDGEIIFTDGAVLDVDWRFGLDSTGPAHKVTLQVIRDLPCSLILSNDVLFQANAYENPTLFLPEEEQVPISNRHASLCVMADRTERKRRLEFILKWFRSHPAAKYAQDLGSTHNAEWSLLDDEVAIQLYEEEYMSCLPQDQRDAAWLDVNEQRRIRKQAQTMPNLLTPTMASSNNPPSSSSTSPSGNGAQPIVTPQTKRIGWLRIFRKPK